jgi:hypothetical protein
MSLERNRRSFLGKAKGEREKAKGISMNESWEKPKIISGEGEGGKGKGERDIYE